MIRDFKFDPDLNTNRKRRARKRLLFAALAALATVAGVVRFAPSLPSPGNAPPATSAEVRVRESIPLALPPRPETKIPDRQVAADKVATSTVNDSQWTPPVARAGAGAAVRHPQRPAQAAGDDAAPSLLTKPDQPAATGAPAAVATAAGIAVAERADAHPVSEPAAQDAPRIPAAVPGVTTAIGHSVGEVGPVEPSVVAAPTWSEHKIGRGDTLAAIFKARGLSPALLHRIVNSGKTAQKLAKIRPGQTLRFLTDAEGDLRRLVLVRDRVNSLEVQVNADQVVAQEVSKDVERRKAGASGLIESSLFVDGQKAGLSDAQIMELAAIFGWDIDFALEIRAGDSFRVLYEEEFLDGSKFRDGPILAAEFTNRGKVYRAVRFEDAQGDANYYDPDGNSKRRAFIRTPIRFARISSRFTRKRWHPVLKRWRSHKGVDYAAPSGTPIKATGAGKVVFRGRKGGYGRAVIIQHGSRYQTLYAHLSKYSRKARQGARVKQGQIIGYVGSSGLATGPHLHYEFRVNGVHRNPLTVKLPKSESLPRKVMASFRSQTAPLLARLDEVENRTMVAQADAAR